MVLFLYPMRNSIFRHPVLLLKLVASVMYVTMGILVLLVPDMLSNMLEGITPLLVNLFAALLIVYGFYRLYRVVTELSEINKPDNDEQA